MQSIVNDYKKLILELLESAKDEEKKKRFTASYILYYKAFVELIDLLIYEKTEQIIENHKDRIGKLKILNNDVSKIRDDLHYRYRQTYRKTADYSDCKTIKNEIQKITILSKLEEDIEKTIKAL